MLVKLHANAATTPRTRGYIQASSASVAELARELGISATTVRRWKGRTETADRSHVPRRLATRFTAEEEEIAVELRTRVGLSLDDVLEVMRRCLRPDISRSALHRCLKRRGVSARPRAPMPETTAWSSASTAASARPSTTTREATPTSPRTASQPTPSETASS